MPETYTPAPRKSWLPSLPTVAGVGCLAMAACGGAGLLALESLHPIMRLKDTVRVDAEKVLETYAANEVRGDVTYGDKRLVVTGQVSHINSSYWGEFVTLGGSEGCTGEGECYWLISDPDSLPTQELALLEKGEEVTLNCFGATLDTRFYKISTAVSLQDCSVVGDAR